MNEEKIRPENLMNNNATLLKGDYFLLQRNTDECRFFTPCNESC